MGEDLRERAAARLERALAEAGVEDPRAAYRARLRELRARDPAALAESVRYYEEVLLPRVADEGSDPIAEWLEYGRLLAELGGPGRVVEVDPSGRARPYRGGSPREQLLLHLPDDPRRAVFVLGMPRELSAPQRATYDLLVLGRVEPD
jgi:hypothetical protein